MSLYKSKPLKTVRFTFCVLSMLMAVSAVAEDEQLDVAAVSAPLQFPTGPSDYTDFYESLQLNFAIDLNSITIPPAEKKGEEKEIRYVLKATSNQGAVNVSYEGIRCDTYQKILYATGHSDGSWHTVRTPIWNAIPKVGINAAHTILAHDFFCEGRTIAGNVNAIQKRIKWHRPLNN